MQTVLSVVRMAYALSLETSHVTHDTAPQRPVSGSHNIVDADLTQIQSTKHDRPVAIWDR